MPNTLIKVDLNAPPTSHDVIHNRWHPDLPMVAWVKPGDEFRVECIDWTGGQIFNDESANDVRDVDLTKVHYLSGPIGVEGREPVAISSSWIFSTSAALPDSEWGFTGIFDRANGGGFLSNITRMPGKLAGISMGFIPLRATSPARNLRGSCTRV